MILAEVRDYLAHARRAPLSDLTAASKSIRRRCGHARSLDPQGRACAGWMAATPAVRRLLRLYRQAPGSLRVDLAKVISLPSDDLLNSPGRQAPGQIFALGRERWPRQCGHGNRFAAGNVAEARPTSG